MFKFAVLLCLVGLSLSSKKIKALKADLAAMKADYDKVVEDTNGSMEELETAIADLVKAVNDMKAEQAQRDIDNQWQALHMAAAAACRGSTPQGGKGPWSNSVIPKENGVKCSDQCKRNTDRTVCKAEVSLTGYPGKATSYTQKVGHFYNYECDGGWNADITHNEVAADEAAITKNNVTAYYRFCCCAKP